MLGAGVCLRPRAGLGPRRAGREADLSPCPSLPDDSAAGPSRSTASHEGRGTRQGGRPCNSRFLREVVPDPGELPARARRVRKNTTPRGPRGLGPGGPQPTEPRREHTDTRNPCDRPVPLRAFTGAVNGAVAITAHNPECRTGFPPARDAERGRSAPRTCARSDRLFSVLALHAPPTATPRWRPRRRTAGR